MVAQSKTSTKIYVFTRNNGDGSSSAFATLDRDLIDKIYKLEDYPYDPYEEFGGNEETPALTLNVPEGIDPNSICTIHSIESFKEY